MKYKVYKIEHNYNQLWHGIKANKNIIVNYTFAWLYGGWDFQVGKGEKRFFYFVLVKM